MDFRKLDTSKPLKLLGADGELIGHIDGRGPEPHPIILPHHELCEFFVRAFTENTGPYLVDDGGLHLASFDFSHSEFVHQLRTANLYFLDPKHYSTPLNPHAVDVPFRIPDLS